MAVVRSYGKGAGTGLNRVLNRENFLYFLDLEVKRSRRYQNFFSIIVLRLRALPEGTEGLALQACYQKLTHLLAEEIRDSDILGTLGESMVAVLLPYADISAGGFMRSRFEDTLRYYDFHREGYRVTVEQVCFPSDVTDTPELVRRVMGTEILNS